MNIIDYDSLIEELVGLVVERPNKADNGTLSGHAAGEPFEKLTYHLLKDKYAGKIFKQFEYLNDLYLKNPRNISVEARKALFESPVALFLLSRSDKATRDWNPENVFAEKQDDTADILWYDDGKFDLIDVKTRNMSKRAMAPSLRASSMGTSRWSCRGMSSRMRAFTMRSTLRSSSGVTALKWVKSKWVSLSSW